MGSKGSQTTTTESGPNPQAMAAYQQLLARAQGVAATPYEGYGGELVAPVNAQQNLGISNVNQGAGFASPFIQQAASYANQAAAPLSQSDIERYLSPYTQNVVNATQAQFSNQNAQQQNQLVGNAAAQNALGGDRVAVAQAQLAGQQNLAQAPVIAGLYGQGYNSAVSTALAQQQAKAQGAYSLGNLGVAGQSAALQGAGAQIGAGNLQQQNQQALDVANYQQFLQRQAFPYQQTQWLAGIDSGVGSQMGGTGSTTGPAPNQGAQWGGLGLAALGMFLNRGGRVPHYDNGGGIGGMPYAGVAGYVPTLSITGGRGAPQAPGVRSSDNSMKGLTDGIKGLSGKLSGFGDAIPTAEQAWGDYGGVPVESLGADFQGGGFRQGGGVRSYDDGGIVNFDDRFSGADLPESFVPRNPVVAGVGTGSIVPNFDERFAPKLIPNALPDDAARVRTLAAPTAGLEPVRDSAPALSEPINIPQRPVAGVGAAPTDPQESTDLSARSTSRGYGDRYARAIGSIESGNNYGTVGPVTRTGDRAYGKYQVMGTNVGPWTRAVLGQEMTPAEFLKNPQAQDAVFQAKFGSYTDKYGPSGAARAWFAGEDGMNDPDRKDMLGTSVADYEGKFNKALGFSPQDEGALPDNATLTQGALPGFAPKTKSDTERSFGLGLLPSDAKTALIAAGLGMMASKSPHLGSAIGEGGLAGLQTYTQLQKQREDRNVQQQRVDLEAKKLSQEADKFAKQMQMQARPYSEMTAAQKAQTEETRRQHDVTQMQPVKIGTDALGREIYGVRDPKSGTIRIIDPATGRTLAPGEKSASPYAPSTSTRGTEDDAALPSTAQPVSGEGGRNEDFLKTLEGADPSLPNLVKKIADYEINPNSLSIKGGHRERILGFVSKYDPTYDQAFYPARAQAQKEFISGGPNSPAGNITSGNTAIQHLGQLAQISEKLGGTNNAWILNKPLNWMNENWEELKNNPDFRQYKSALERYAEEATKFYRGVGGSLADVERSIHNLSAGQSPAARAAAIAQEADLMRSKINALQDRWKTALGGVGGWQAALKRAGVSDFPIIQKKSEEALHQIEDLHHRHGEAGKPAEKQLPARVKQDGHTYEKQADGSYKAVD
jgi:hypothetical protein